MPGLLKNAFFWLLLLFAVAAGLWTMQEKSPQLSDTGSSGHIADAYMRGAVIHSFDINGARQQSLKSTHLVHYLDDSTTDLTSPYLNVYNDTAPPWVIQSETGRLSADGNLLYLDGAVDIQRDRSATRPPLKVITRDLAMNREDGYAESAEHATLLHGIKNRMEGDGLQAWLHEPMRVKLLSNVRGRYVQ